MNAHNYSVAVAPKLPWADHFRYLRYLSTWGVRQSEGGKEGREKKTKTHNVGGAAPGGRLPIASER